MNIRSSILKGVYEYVNKLMSDMDPAHSIDHIYRVVSITKKLCSEYPETNILLAEIIALLHEMNDDKLFPPNQLDNVRDILSQLSLSEENICFIIEGISLISYRKHPSLTADVPLEIKIVQDADRIDAIGAMGIARAFAFGGSKGYPLYSINPDTNSIIKHFDDKLLLIYDLLNTDAAKKYAKERHKFLEEFRTMFIKELNEIDD